MKKLLLFSLLLLLSLSSLSAQNVHERLIWGTGEYSPQSNWHGILQFDRADTMSSGIQHIPSSTIPIKQCSDNGVNLNFGHGFYYREATDELYVSTLFDNSANILTTNSDTAKGSIAIFQNISTLDGQQTITRRLFGPQTQIRQPHGCWVDESRDILYVANTFGNSVLVFDSASVIDGNRAPDRVIPINGAPVYVFTDPAVDRIFVTVMPAGAPGTNPRVEIFNNASTAGASSAPNIRIEGPNTRLNIGNMTIHNAWFNPAKNLLAIGHHTSELLIYNLNNINWGASPTQNYDLSPRVIYIADTNLYAQNDINLYGLFWDLETDRMFCSVGIDNPGGGPMPGTPPSAIKVYENVSDSTVSGFITPSKTYMWSNSNTYYPPQPVWVKKTQVTSTFETKFDNSSKIYPVPSYNELTVEVKNNVSLNYYISNPFGQTLIDGKILGEISTINIEILPKGIYLLTILHEKGNETLRFIKD